MAQAALGRLDGKKSDDGEQFEITSPSAGRVLKVFVESEGIVQAGSQLLEIGDPKALEVAVDVLTSDAVHIKPSAPVSLEHWGGSPLAATVRMIEPSAFTRVSALGVEEQRVNAILEINSTFEEWRLLGDGYRVEARIETYRNPAALRIPWSALFRQGDGWAVFVQAGEVARLRKVEVGKRNETSAEVLSGLSPNERVIIHPSDKIVDGAKVVSSS
jgi:HlyD family secretion protein